LLCRHWLNRLWKRNGKNSRNKEENTKMDKVKTQRRRKAMPAQMEELSQIKTPQEIERDIQATEKNPQEAQKKIILAMMENIRKLLQVGNAPKKLRQKNARMERIVKEKLGQL